MLLCMKDQRPGGRLLFDAFFQWLVLNEERFSQSYSAVAAFMGFCSCPQHITLWNLLRFSTWYFFCRFTHLFATFGFFEENYGLEQNNGGAAVYFLLKVFYYAVSVAVPLLRFNQLSVNFYECRQRNYNVSFSSIQLWTCGNAVTFIVYFKNAMLQSI